MKTLPFTVALAATLVLSACSDTTNVATDDNTNNNTGTSTGNVDANFELRSRLQTFDNSEAFLTALKEALINQNTDYATSVAEIAVDEVAIATDAIDGSDVSAESAPQAGSDSNSSASSTVSEGATADNEVSSTNVQETGVDEQDRVKLNAAGTQLFVLNNDYSYFTSPITQNQTGGATTTDVSTTDSEPVDQDVISSSDVASSSSLVGGQEVTTTLRILSLDSEAPDAMQTAEVDIDLQGRDADGFYLYEADGEAHAIITASGGGYWSYWNSSFAFEGLESVITKVDVSNAADAAVEDTFTLDGQIVSSRRIGDSLFFASRFYPSIPGVQPWEAGTVEWQNAVEAADLSDLLPQYTRDSSEESSDLVNPASCFVAPVADDQLYYSPDIITLGVIDLNTMQLSDSQCFLGATETLYANTESVFLATTKYDYQSGPITTDGQSVDVDIDVFAPDLVWSDPRTTTEIHEFEIQGDQLNYEGSGSVRGHLGWNDLQKPFRMSERDGYLRVATMNDQQGPDHSPILINVLQANGQGSLELVSSLPNDTHPEHIGKPGEQLYASRFLDDRAYLVTFRQTDPLYVVDLADPANPEVTGELEIEGYSDYLHPMGENFLLGIGKDAISAGDGQGDGRGAFVQGIKLSLFDVTDPVEPVEVQSVLVGERGTDSIALSNYRAITIQAATENHPARVSFGINVHGEAFPASSPSSAEAFNYAPWSYTGLHGFDVEVGVNAGITSRGALVVEQADTSGGLFFPFNFADDRSVMVNDAVYYVHGRDVYPAIWDNLAVEPVAR